MPNPDVNAALRAWYASVNGTPARETPAAPDPETDPDAPRPPADLGQGNQGASSPPERASVGDALRALRDDRRR